MKQLFRSHLVRAVSLALVAVLFLAVGTTWRPAFRADANTNISQLQQKYDKLEQQQKDLKNQLAALQNKANSTQQQINTVQQQINSTQQQVDLLYQQVDERDKAIATKEKQLAAAQQSIDSYYETAKKRLRALYMEDTGSTLSMLLGAQSIAEFLSVTENMRATAAYDKALLAKLKKDKQQIADAKKVIESERASIMATKKQADSKLNSLEGQYKQAQNLSAQISSDTAAAKAKQQALVKELSKLNSEIEALVKAQQNTGQYVGGKWGWPTPNYHYITSYYGWRTISGIRDYHTGIDISGGGIYGTNIVAANAGKVSKVGWQGNGYGHYLMVDHGGGNYTLYAHCSAILVRTGQVVAKGQPIARVGSSGWSTGPHLHFELWLNQQRVNPLNYY